MNGQAIAWVDGVWFGDAADASVSVLDHGLLYGDGVFEGVRFYAATPFLLETHLRRLRASARCLLIDIPYDDGELVGLCNEAIARFGDGDGYLRLIVTRGRGDLGVSPHSCVQATTILVAAALRLYPPEIYLRGVDMLTSSLRRAAPDSLPPQIKSLNYLTSVLSTAQARACGAHEALLLNAAGEITEGSVENVFVVTHGRVRTPPVAAGALNGITREHVIALLAADRVGVAEQTLLLADVWSADEMFLCGTAAEILPVASIDGRPLTVPGALTRRVQELFAASLPR